MDEMILNSGAIVEAIDGVAGMVRLCFFALCFIVGVLIGTNA